MDDFNLTTAVLAAMTKEELMALVQAQRRAEANVPSSELARDLEDVIQALFDDSMIPMIMVDEKGRFRRINRSFRDLTGYDEADLLSQTLGHHTHPADHREVEEVRRSLQNDGAITQALEKKNRLQGRQRAELQDQAPHYPRSNWCR